MLPLQLQLLLEFPMRDIVVDVDWLCLCWCLSESDNSRSVVMWRSLQPGLDVDVVRRRCSPPLRHRQLSPEGATSSSAARHEPRKSSHLSYPAVYQHSRPGRLTAVTYSIIFIAPLKKEKLYQWYAGPFFIMQLLLFIAIVYCD